MSKVVEVMVRDMEKGRRIWGDFMLMKDLGLARTRFSFHCDV